MLVLAESKNIPEAPRAPQARAPVQLRGLLQQVLQDREHPLRARHHERRGERVELREDDELQVPGEEDLVLPVDRKDSRIVWEWSRNLFAGDRSEVQKKFQIMN